MYQFLEKFHSGMRWIVLIMLVLAIVNALLKMRSKSAFGPTDKKWGLFALISTHIQFLVGLVLYFISPWVQFGANTMKETAIRFYTVEHITIMILAIVLITVGYSKSKRQTEDHKKFKTLFTFFVIGLLLILAGIPWPFREALGAGWY